METPRYQFGEFILDIPDRQLWKDGVRIDLNSRYLDALILLVLERDQLVSKDRLFDEVWYDMVVSESALTQCIKDIRKQLGDEASNPRFIQTVPRHGYRFIGKVTPLLAKKDDLNLSHSSVSPSENDSTEGFRAESSSRPEISLPKLEKSIWSKGWFVVWAGTLGGGSAGVIGGMFYGFGLAAENSGVGTLSTLFVLISLTGMAGLIGGFGVSLGIGSAEIISSYAPKSRGFLCVAGAAFGGFFVGGMAKLLGVDAFHLVVGLAPAGITGGPEGALLGGLLVLGAQLGNRIIPDSERTGKWRTTLGAGFGGATAGVLIPLLGGHLMGGSLDQLTKAFAQSNLQLDRFGSLFGEVRFGGGTEVVLAGFEGLLFGVFLMGALTLLERFR